MKKITIPLITLIVGFAMGYLVCKQSSSPSFADEKQAFIDNNKLVFSSASYGGIDSTLAKQMLNKYKSENENNTLLLGSNGKPLRGFTIPKADLDAIFKNKNNDAVSIYLAKEKGHLTDNGRYYTLVFLGKKLKTVKRDATTGEDINGDDDTAQYYDQVDVCPNKCSTSN